MIRQHVRETSRQVLGDFHGAEELPEVVVPGAMPQHPLVQCRCMPSHTG